MSYVIYALFQEPGMAEVALQDLARADIPEKDCHIFVHKKKLTQGNDLRASECDGRQGLAIGIVTGIVCGALMGWLIAGPLHLWTLPLSAAMGLGIFLGVICGALGGGIYGTGLLQSNLKRLSDRFSPGQTLITAEIESLQCRDIVDQIFKKHGAIEATR